MPDSRMRCSSSSILFGATLVLGGVSTGCGDDVGVMPAASSTSTGPAATTTTTGVGDSSSGDSAGEGSSSTRGVGESSSTGVGTTTGTSTSSGSETTGGGEGSSESSTGAGGASCGDGVLDASEACEAGMVGDTTCPVFGEVVCADDCTLDLSGCSSTLTVCSAPAAFLGVAQTEAMPLVDVVSVTDDFFVADVDVSVDITHPWVGDLVARLDAPQGVASSVLFAAPCGLGTNIDAEFDDGGMPPSCGGTPALSGTVTPQTELRDLVGISALGEWALVAWDEASFADNGTLQSWCLELSLSADDPVLCGDGVAHFGEACDGDDLNGNACTTVPGGFASGTLACAADCTFDTSGCSPDPCGNGLLDAGEACDGDALAGATCDDVPGFAGAGLSCASDCTFDTTACEEVTCGDGIVNGPEACDPMALGSSVCEDFPGYLSGTLGCAADCSAFDLDGCVATFVEACSTPSAAISDLLGPTSDTVEFADIGTVADVNVHIDLAHTWVGDVQLDLISPLGTSVLVFDACGNVDDIAAVFDDEGSPVACGGSPGVSGTVQPNEALAVFDGESFAGQWQLVVTDVSSGDDGVLAGWCVRITPTEG